MQLVHWTFVGVLVDRWILNDGFDYEEGQVTCEELIRREDTVTTMNQ